MVRVLAAVLILLLAGCAEPPALEEPDEVADACVAEGVCGEAEILAEDGRDLRTDLTAEDRLDAPEWDLGDVFEQHLFLGQNDKAGTHIQTIVIEADRGYTIATPDEQSAVDEAVYDLPILGNIGPELQTTGFGSDWSWMYDFPLSDGKTWQGRVEGLLNFNTYSFRDHELTMLAEYDAAIDTPRGAFPGFWITATDADGDVLARYNYVPAIGWFSHFWLYDLDNGGDTFSFHAMSMGTSKGYTGPFITASAETVLDHWSGVFPDLAGPIQGDPLPQAFTMPESDRMVGIVVPIAVGGQTQVTLTAPSGDPSTYTYQQLSFDGPGFTVIWLDEDAQPGAWEMRTVGVGLAAGAYVWLSAVTVTDQML